MRMWGGEGGSKQLKEMGRTRRTLASGARGGCEEKESAPEAKQHLVEGKEPQRWPRSKMQSPLLCLVSFLDRVQT